MKIYPGLSTPPNSNKSRTLKNGVGLMISLTLSFSSPWKPKLCKIDKLH